MRVMGDCAFLHCPPIINIESKSHAFIQQTSLTLTLSGRMWMCIFQTGTTESPWSAGGQRAGRQTVNWTCSDIQWRRNQVSQVCTVDSSNLFKLRVSLLWCVQPVGECTDIRTVAYPWKKKIKTHHNLHTQCSLFQPHFLHKLSHCYLKILHRWRESQPPLSHCTPRSNCP